MARADEILNERKRVDYQSLEPDGVRTALAAVQLRCYLRAHRDDAADLPYGRWIACSVWSACQCVVCVSACAVVTMMEGVVESDVYMTTKPRLSAVSSMWSSWWR